MTANEQCIDMYITRTFFIGTMYKNIFFLFVTAGLSSFGLAKETHLGEFKERSQQRLSFTENKGQFADQHYKPRPDVLFGGSDGQMSFYITNKGISYQLYRVDHYMEVEDIRTNEKRKIVGQQTIYRTDIKWLDANPQATIKTDEPLPGVTNYYLTQCQDGALNVKSYKGLSLQNIYRDIDLHYYESDGHLKYDYIVAPHADYEQIRFKVEGAILRQQQDGSLIIETPLGEIHEEAPLVFQNGKQLKANYRVADNIVSFEIENYDANYVLIIDPVARVWGTFYGGTGREIGYSSATDALGNVYMTGETTSLTGTIIATTGSHQSVHAGGPVGDYFDAFLVKFNPSGVRLWGTYYGGSATDYGYYCATDVSGNVYMTGYSTSTNGTSIATLGSHQPLQGGATQDAFLVKFNSNGVRQWGTYYGGNGNEVGLSCATDGSGNVYLAGFTDSNNGTMIATPSSHQPAHVASRDAFLAKFNSNGVRLWGTYYGGMGSEDARSCAVDGLGNVYMTGFTDSSNGIATGSSHQNTFGGGVSDGFLVKFNANGVRLWGTYYGGISGDSYYSCALDANGDVYAAGYSGTPTSTVIATSSSHQNAFGGVNDAILVKFNSNGVRQWGTYYGGAGDDRAHYCAIDASGNICMAGLTGSNSGTTISTPGSHQFTYGGGSHDAFLVEFTNSGIRNWGTYYGGTGVEIAYSCSGDTFGNMFMTGTPTSNGTVIATPGSHQPTNGGGLSETFLVKFADCETPNAIPTISVNSGSLCSGNSFTISPSGANTYTIQGGSSVVSPAASTSYSVVGTSTTGCISSNTAICNLTVYLTPTVTVNSGIICSGNSFTITPSGADTYTVQGGSFIVSPGTSNFYQVFGTTTAGCTSASPAVCNVTVNATPTIAVNSGSICNGNSFTIYPTGASVYSIQNGNAIVYPGTTTSYTVAGTSAEGCISANPATCNVVVHPYPLPTINVNSGGICIGDSFTISPSGASTYTVQGGNWVVTPLSSTSYTVIGTSSAGCLSGSFSTSSITVNPLPTISVNSGSVCGGDSFTISPTGATNYTVEGGNFVVTPSISSNFTVIGANAAGCISASPAVSSIIVVPSPTINVFSSDSLVCSGETVTITASGASNYTFNPLGLTGTNIVISPTINTSFSVVGVDSNSCYNSKVFVQYVDECVGIQELIPDDQDWKVFPNPCSGIITIQSKDSKPNTIEVFNSLGQLVFRAEITEQSFQIDLTKSATGVYFLRKGGKSKKIIKD